MREQGFYWVRDPISQEWHVAYWYGRFWQLVGIETDFSDNDFDLIDTSPLQPPTNH